MICHYWWYIGLAAWSLLTNYRELQEMSNTPPLQEKTKKEAKGEQKKNQKMCVQVSIQEVRAILS